VDRRKGEMIQVQRISGGHGGGGGRWLLEHPGAVAGVGGWGGRPEKFPAGLGGGGSGLALIALAGWL